ncbi:MAG TPA: putative PEP-binding protein, partial [Polyangia bacterium]
RAFLRVSGLHPVSILLPVVGGVEEVRETRAIIRRLGDQLAAEGIAFDRNVAVGAMIEVPSAALLTPALAKEVDFFSLGTNDLVQYVLAADREDETVADYYLPHHPGVLRLLKFVADSARQAGRPLTICGEMAGDATYTALLLGLGLEAFSVAPGEMLDVKNAIRNTVMEEARQLATRALELGTASEVEALLKPNARVRTV